MIPDHGFLVAAMDEAIVTGRKELLENGVPESELDGHLRAAISRIQSIDTAGKAIPEVNPNSSQRLQSDSERKKIELASWALSEIAKGSAKDKTSSVWELPEDHVESLLFKGLVYALNRIHDLDVRFERKSNLLHEIEMRADSSFRTEKAIHILVWSDTDFFIEYIKAVQIPVDILLLDALIDLKDDLANEAVLELLVRYPESYEKTDWKNEGIFSSAILVGNATLIEKLIANNFPHYDCNIDFAVRYRPEVLPLLINTQKRKDYVVERLVPRAIIEGNISLLEKFVQSGISLKGLPFKKYLIEEMLPVRHLSLTGVGDWISRDLLSNPVSRFMIKLRMGDFRASETEMYRFVKSRLRHTAGGKSFRLQQLERILETGGTGYELERWSELYHFLKAQGAE